MIMPLMGRFLFSCLLLIPWNKHNIVDCIGNFVGFTRHETLNKTMCPANAVIQNVHLKRSTLCFLLCSNQPSCRGLLFEPVGMQCVTCSVEMPMFYNRKEVPKFRLSQYKLIRDLMSWENSQQKCESLGGDLLSITSKEENDFIVTQVIQNVSMDIWTSAKGLGGQADTFKWSDGSALSDGFTNWGERQPGPFRQEEKCVAIIPNYFTWNDANCPKNFYCICEFR